MPSAFLSYISARDCLSLTRYLREVVKKHEPQANAARTAHNKTAEDQARKIGMEGLVDTTPTRMLALLSLLVNLASCMFTAGWHDDLKDLYDNYKTKPFA